MDEIKLDEPKFDHVIALEDIQIDVNIQENVKEKVKEKEQNYVIDWLGRKRTIKEIKDRDVCRCNFLMTVLSCVYVISLITFLILSIVYQKNEPVFIASLVMLSILGAPIVFGLLVFLVNTICQCCCEML